MNMRSKLYSPALLALVVTVTAAAVGGSWRLG